MRKKAVIISYLLLFSIIFAAAKCGTPVTPVCEPHDIAYDTLIKDSLNTNPFLPVGGQTAVMNSKLEYEAFFADALSFPGTVLPDADFGEKTLIGVKGGYSCGPYTCAISGIRNDCDKIIVSVDQHLPCGTCYTAVIDTQHVVVIDKTSLPVEFVIRTNDCGIIQ